MILKAHGKLSLISVMNDSMCYCAVLCKLHDNPMPSQEVLKQMFQVRALQSAVDMKLLCHKLKTCSVCMIFSVIQ